MFLCAPNSLVWLWLKYYVRRLKKLRQMLIAQAPQTSTMWAQHINVLTNGKKPFESVLKSKIMGPTLIEFVTQCQLYYRNAHRKLLRNKLRSN